MWRLPVRDYPLYLVVNLLPVEIQSDKDPGYGANDGLKHEHAVCLTSVEVEGEVVVQDIWSYVDKKRIFTWNNSLCHNEI